MIIVTHCTVTHASIWTSTHVCNVITLNIFPRYYHQFTHATDEQQHITLNFDTCYHVEYISNISSIDMACHWYRNDGWLVNSSGRKRVVGSQSSPRWWRQRSSLRRWRGNSRRPIFVSEIHWAPTYRALQWKETHDCNLPRYVCTTYGPTYCPNILAQHIGPTYWRTCKCCVTYLL